MADIHQISTSEPAQRWKNDVKSTYSIVLLCVFFFIVSMNRGVKTIVTFSFTNCSNLCHGPATIYVCAVVK